MKNVSNLTTGLLVSLLLHFFILGGAWLFSDKTFLAETAEEIYEASDVVADFVPELDELSIKDMQKIAKNI